MSSPDREQREKDEWLFHVVMSIFALFMLLWGALMMMTVIVR